MVLNPDFHHQALLSFLKRFYFGWTEYRMQFEICFCVLHTHTPCKKRPELANNQAFLLFSRFGAAQEVAPTRTHSHIRAFGSSRA